MSTPFNNVEQGLGSASRRGSAIEVRTGSVSHAVAVENLPSKGILEDASNAQAREQNMTLLEGIKTFPKAIGWSLLFSTAIIMEGYDITILGSFFISPVFIEAFGVSQPDGTKHITAEWQSGLGVAMQSGQILGLFATGILADKFGYKKVMISSMFWVIATVFILFFAKNVIMLLVGEFLMGFPLGVFQTLSVTYATEVCPTVLRPYLTTYVNLCWVLGQLLASAITKGMFETRHDQWLYRIPFALQWAWPVPIVVGIFLAPESPWWLVRVGRLSEAKQSVLRLSSNSNPTNADETVAMMIHTNEIEKEMSAGISYLDCFKGVDLRRTEIACLTWACQNLCGSGLMGASSYFYNAAGLAPSHAYTMALIQYALGAIGVVLAWFAMTRFGRRTLYVYGLATLCVLMFVVGCISLAPNAMNEENRSVAASWATGSMLLLFTFVYDFTVGPICYSLVSEIPSTRLRQKTVVLARNLYNICGLCLGFLIPYMRKSSTHLLQFSIRLLSYTVNPSAWNLMGRSGFIWFACAALCTTWAYFRLPEPKGRTFAELDVLFEKKVSARKFASTSVDLFEGQHPAVDSVTVETKQ
jgi:MFS transporter, SP family, general alpha glucoside:H+ symporter